MPDFTDENGVFDLNKKLAWQIANQKPVLTQEQIEEQEYQREKADAQKWKHIHAIEQTWERAAEEFLSRPIILLHEYREEVENIEFLRTKAERLGVDYSSKGRYGCRISGSANGDSMMDTVIEIVDAETRADIIWGDYLKAVYETMETLRVAPLTRKQRAFARAYACSFEPFDDFYQIGIYIDVKDPWHMRHKMRRALGKWLLSLDED